MITNKKQKIIGLIQDCSRTISRFVYQPSKHKFISSSTGKENLFCIFSVDGPSTLCVVDLNSGVLKSAVNEDLFRRQLSKEEVLLKQRKRDLSKGINNFDSVTYHEKPFITFTSGSEVYLYDIRKGDDYVMTNVSGDSELLKLDVKFSHDGKFFCFVNNGNLHLQVSDIPKQWTKLTDCDPEKGISAGLADYIIQEEFDRTTGYWICDKLIEGQYCIAYLEVDSSKVPIVKVAKPGLDFTFESYRYPRPGETNAVSVLCTMFIDPKTFSVTKVERHGKLFEKKFGWMEYVVDMGWVDERIWMKLVDRKQQRLEIALFDPVGDNDIIRVINYENSKYWVNVDGHNCSSVTFLVSSPSRCIVGTEKGSGFHHLYLMRYNEKTQEFDVEKTLTSGEWPVSPKEKFYVDEEREVVYFVANKDNALQTHLYMVSYADDGSGSSEKGQGEGVVTKVTPGNDVSYFNFTFDAKFKRFVCNYSGVGTVKSCGVFEREKNGSFTLKRRIYENLLPSPQEQAIMLQKAPKPEFFQFKSSLSGKVIHGVVYLPYSYKLGELCPCINYVYGGPHVQLVKDRWTTKLDTRAAIYTRLGYIFVIIDGEGSYNRGVEFEGVIRCKMGQIELATQREGIEYLRKKQGIGIDPKRIGIVGYSYGGYLALMAAAKHNDFYKCCVAGSPVTNWMLYDTGYTERYMDLPQDNKEGYEKGNVLTFVKNFPEQENRVLITHGMQDENVLFKHTEMLLSELSYCLKPYNVAIYPSLSIEWLDFIRNIRW